MRFVFSERMDEVRLAVQRPEGLAPLAARASQAGQGLFPSASTRPALVGAAAWFRLMVQDAATDIVTALFPTDCLLCGGPMTTHAPERVCEACIAAVRLQNDALCSRCGEALGMESARFAASLRVTECTACRLAPPLFARAASYAAFEDNVRELLHLLKFGGQRALAERVLGRWLAAAILTVVESQGTEFVVVPVPMFRAREKDRGFNQAHLLGASAIRFLRKERPEIRFVLNGRALERKRDTQALFALTSRQRRRNLKGAFSVPDAESVRGHTVVLVDDILTTGATARECARVLLGAGANAVLVATVARAQPESALAHEAWAATPRADAATDASALVAHWDAGTPTHSRNGYSAWIANDTDASEDEGT